MNFSFTSKLWITVIVMLTSCLLLLAPTCSHVTCLGDREARNRSSIKGLEIALNSYYIEYNKVPLPLDYADSGTKPLRAQGTIIKLLMAQDKTHNSRSSRFLEPSKASPNRPGLAESHSGPNIIDSWGQPLYILTATKGSNTIDSPQKPGTIIESRFAIYSAGPDEDPDTWKDNVMSWTID